MKKAFLTALILLCVLFLVSCPELEPTLNLEENLWGEWIRIDNGEAWYITANSILIKGSSSYSSPTPIDSSRSVKLKKQSANVVQVKEGDRIYYLFASRLPNARFTGRIAEFDQGSRSTARSVAGGKGYIQVVVENLDNGTTATTSTDADGDFSVDNAIPGDDYKITPKGGNPYNFTPVGNGDDAGTVTIVNGDDVNFKCGISSKSSSSYYGYNSQDLSMLTAKASNGNNPSYNLYLTIENTGKKDATAATYQLTLDNGLNLGSDNSSGILGTIEPGKTKEISLKLSCSSDSISGDYAFKKIGITINDPINNKTWNDSVSIRFFKEIVKIEYSSSKVNGMVITPSNQAFRLNSGVDVPKLTDGDYLFIFSGATADTEGSYSINIQGLSKDKALDLDTARYEPNDTEETATRITSGINAYLHKNDIDYYKFSFSGFGAITGEQLYENKWADASEKSLYSFYVSEGVTYYIWGQRVSVEASYPGGSNNNSSTSSSSSMLFSFTPNAKGVATLTVRPSNSGSSYIPRIAYNTTNTTPSSY